MSSEHSVHVLIPVKGFDQAKARLAPVFSQQQRAQFAREWATGVVRACTGFATWVVCDNEQVASWAHGMGAHVSWQPGLGLNGAVRAATVERFTAGASRVTVVHGDIPHAPPLTDLVRSDDDLVLVPDRHELGTNVLSTPTPNFRFAYGQGSFAAHCDEAVRLGLRVRIVNDSRWGWDVDVPDDLVEPGP